MQIHVDLSRVFLSACWVIFMIFSLQIFLTLFSSKYCFRINIRVSNRLDPDQADILSSKVSKDAKIRNRYNQVPHLTQDTNGKVTNSQLDTTNESQEVSPFPAGDHKAHINRLARRHSKRKTEKTKQVHKRSTTLERSETKLFTKTFS